MINGRKKWNFRYIYISLSLSLSRWKLKIFLRRLGAAITMIRWKSHRAGTRLLRKCFNEFPCWRRSRSLHRIAIPNLFLPPPLAIAIIFSRREQLFGVRLPANSPRKLPDVSNVLESVVRELNAAARAGKFESRGPREKSPSFGRVTRARAIARVRSSADTTVSRRPSLLITARLDIRRTVEKSSRPIRYHQFSLGARARVRTFLIVTARMDL